MQNSSVINAIEQAGIIPVIKIDRPESSIGLGKALLAEGYLWQR